MTRQKTFGLAAAALAAVTALAVAPAFAAPPTDRPAPGQGPRATAPATAPMSDQEKADLTWSREEERLAKELYQALGEKWGVTEFTRIATSEQRHLDAMGAALQRYGLPDPSANSKVGVYADPELQRLWTDWHNRGMESKEKAFAVGVELEQRDIADLKEAIETSDNADLDQAYGNLLRGSEHHLAAFEALSRGETPAAMGRQGQAQGPGKGQGKGMQGRGGQQRQMNPENCPAR